MKDSSKPVIGQEIWSNKKTKYEKKTDANHEVIGIKGVAYYKNTFFKFSLKKQITSDYLYRGTLSVLDSAQKVLQYHGVERNQIAKRIKDKHNNSSDNDNNTEKTNNTDKKYKDSRFNCTASLYCNETDDEKIKNYLSKQIIDLYQKCFPSILSDQQLSVVPELLTFDMAANLYAESAMDWYYKHANEKTQKRRIKHLKLICANFSDTSLNRFTEKKANKILREKNISDSDRKLLAVFWNFLIERGKVNSANNPFLDERKETSKRKKNSEQMQYDASVQKTLDKYEDKFEKKIHQEPTSQNCAMILIRNGVHAFKIEEVLCGNFFTAANGELCLSLNYNYAGATHRYVVPILGEDASLLRKKIEIIKEKWPNDFEKHCVCHKARSDKPLTTSEINSYFRKIAREIGIEDDIRKRTGRQSIKPLSTSMLINSHNENIENDLGLMNDPGTISYLEQKALASVSDNHYVSYSDDVAIDRLCTILRVLEPEIKNSNLHEEEDTEDGMKKTVIKPESNKYKCSFVGEIEINPGDIVEIKADHGVKINIDTIKEIG